MGTMGMAFLSFYFCILFLSVDGNSKPSAYEVLKRYNLPIHVLPRGALGYTLDRNSGQFSVILSSNCNVHVSEFDVKYNSPIMGVIFQNNQKLHRNHHPTLCLVQDAILKELGGKKQVPQDLGRPTSDAAIRELILTSRKPHNTPSQGHRAEEGTSRKGLDLDMSAACLEALNQGAAILSHQGKEIRKEKQCSKGWRRVYSTGSETRGRVHLHTRTIKGVGHTTVAAKKLKATTRVLAQEKQSLLPKNVITKEHPHKGWKRCEKAKVATSNRERKKSFPSWKQQEVGHKQNFKKGGFWNQQRLERKQDKFTLLIKTPKEILALDKGKFKPPPPMTTPVEKRKASKFYEFHGEVGHTTDEYMHLKRKIEECLKQESCHI
ncbi:reverse transcriptase domain-containing protein [Tanacetum coccineum]